MSAGRKNREPKKPRIAYAHYGAVRENHYMKHGRASMFVCFLFGSLLAACSSAPASVPTAAAAPTPAAAPTLAPAPTQTITAMPNFTLNTDTLPAYEKLELTLDPHASYDNPFDPAQIDVLARFTGPDGTTLNVPGFFWQDFSSALEGGKEVLTSRGQPAWKVRFSPPAPGAWSVVVEATTPAGSATSAPAQFTVTPARRHGPVRIDPRDPAYFALSDGTPFLAIGQNVGWYGAGGTHDYERWFGRMHAQGANFARLWMASWAFGIEWQDTGLGDYTKRLDRAWQLDRAFELAEQNDIYIMLALLNHGAFNTGVNPEWAGNPYNAANGGPLAKPEEFASNAQARDLFKRRLRYIAARWGYSPNLLAWEWWNEVDWTPMKDTAIQQPWIREMSAELAKYDPYPHLRTTSYAGSDDAVFAMPEIDIAQRHIYNPADPAETFARAMKEMAPLGKPALVGEFGTGAESADATIDPQGVHIHNGLWAGLMTKGAGTGMTWWWDSYIDPLDLYPLFHGAAAFFQNEDLAANGYKTRRPVVAGAPATLLLLGAPDRMLGWVRSNAFSYDGLRAAYSKALRQAMAEKRTLGTFTPEFAPVEGASWKLNGLDPGTYTVEWWDTAAGTVIVRDTLTVTADGATLAFPPFARDLAFKIKPA